MPNRHKDKFKANLNEINVDGTLIHDQNEILKKVEDHFKKVTFIDNSMMETPPPRLLIQTWTTLMQK